jgi:hypothetical protein
LVEDLDGVDAGEEEPVECVELGEGGVERGVGFGRDDFDGGDEDGDGSEGFELEGEFGGLMSGAGYEDALLGEGRHWISLGGVDRLKEVWLECVGWEVSVQ